MSINRKSVVRLKRLEPLPLPANLEQAFAEIETLDIGHPHARGMTFGGIRAAEARGDASFIPMQFRATSPHLPGDCLCPSDKDQHPHQSKQVLQDRRRV